MYRLATMLWHKIVANTMFYLTVIKCIIFTMLNYLLEQCALTQREVKLLRM